MFSTLDLCDRLTVKEEETLGNTKNEEFRGLLMPFYDFDEDLGTFGFIGNNGIKIIMIKKLEKEREKQRKENELIIAKRRELEAAIRNHRSKVLAAKSRFEHGEPESALRVAELILQSPDFSPGRFEEARDWLNKAKDKGLVSIRLLYLFLKECKRLPNPESHIKRYRQIIQSCQAGRFGKFTFYEI